MLEEEKRQVHMHNNSNKELCAPISTFREDGNVQDLLKDLYLQSVVLSSISSSTVTFLQAQTIAQLHQLALQIKTKIHDHKKEFTALDNTLISARSTTTELQQRLTASLEQSTIKSSSSASAASIIDPWLAKIALKRHLTFCTKKHKEWMQQLQQQQHSISSFTWSVQQQIRQIIKFFNEWKLEKLGIHEGIYTSLNVKIDTMKQNEEWDYFKTHLNPLLSSSLLLKEATKTATITDSEVDATSTTPSELDTVAAVDGISDSMLEIIREGIIYHFAEGGLFKRSKWIPTHVVFTARGFIHLFPLDEDTAASLPPNRTSNPVIFSSDPSASLYLPNFDLSTLLTAEEPPASTAHKRQSKSSNRNSVFNQELLLFPLGLTEFKISERPPTGLLSSFSKRLREDRFGFANRDTAEFWWQLMSEKCVNTRQNGATAQQSSSVSSILALPSFSSLSITTSDTTKTAVAEKPVLQEERHVGEGGAVKELSGLSPSSSSSSIATSSSASLLLNRSSSSSSTYSNSSSTKLDMSSSSLETIPESGGVRDGSSSSGDKDGIVVSLNEPIKENPWGNV